MTHWSDRPQTEVVGQLTPVAAELRAALFKGPFVPESHDALFDGLPALRQIERGGLRPSRGSLATSARLIFWNVERLRHLEAIAGHLKAHRPDVVLLSEVDRGMARTGNTDRVAILSERLQMGFLYAVEFVELGLGDIHEQRDHAGEVNAAGFHGAAILSDLPLQAPALIRIERRGEWFGLDRHEPRVGSTIALLAFIAVAGEPVLMVNVHLESHCDPQTRAVDMGNILRMVEGLAPGGRVVMGGDFNTSTTSYAERLANPRLLIEALEQDPMRLLRPELHEPLFAEAAALGYDWQACNLADMPTTRRPAGSTRPPAKIDWVFTRGLVVSDPAIIPAVLPDGTPASDHEGLMLTVAPD